MVNLKTRYTHFNFRRSYPTIFVFRMFDEKRFYCWYLASSRLAFRRVYRASSSVTFFCRGFVSFNSFSDCSHRCNSFKLAYKLSLRLPPVRFRRYLRVGYHINDSSLPCQVVKTSSGRHSALHKVGERHHRLARIAVDAIYRVFQRRLTGGMFSQLNQDRY